jgi:hypothetical protein
MKKVEFVAKIGETDTILTINQIMNVNNLIVGNLYVIYIKDFYDYDDYEDEGDYFYRGTFVRVENDIAFFTDIKVVIKKYGRPLLRDAFYSERDTPTNYFFDFATTELRVSQDLLNNGICKLFEIEVPEMDLPVPTPAPENIEPVITKIIKKIAELKSKGEQHSSGVLYTTDNIIMVLVYLKLLEKYGNKCSVVTVDNNIFELDSEIAFSGIELDYMDIELKEHKLNYLGETLKDCVDRGVDIIIIPLILLFKRGSHANILIYKPKQKLMERFEPHGIGSHTDTFDDLLSTIVTEQLRPFLGPLTYASTNQICPNSKGFQALENTLKVFDIKEGGFCMMWSCFMAEMVLMNPENTTKEIIDEVFAITKKDPMYLKQIIRGYVKDAEEMIDELIQSVSDDTFRFIESDNGNEESIDVIDKNKGVLKRYAINVILNSKQPLFNSKQPSVESKESEDVKMGVGGKRTRKYRNKKRKSRNQYKRRKSVKKRY